MRNILEVLRSWDRAQAPRVLAQYCCRRNRCFGALDQGQKAISGNVRLVLTVLGKVTEHIPEEPPCPRVHASCGLV